MTDCSLLITEALKSDISFCLSSIFPFWGKKQNCYWVHRRTKEVFAIDFSFLCRLLPCTLPATFSLHVPFTPQCSPWQPLLHQIRPVRLTCWSSNQAELSNSMQHLSSARVFQQDISLHSSSTATLIFMDLAEIWLPFRFLPSLKL